MGDADNDIRSSRRDISKDSHRDCNGLCAYSKPSRNLRRTCLRTLLAYSAQTARNGRELKTHSPLLQGRLHAWRRYRRFSSSLGCASMLKAPRSLKAAEKCRSLNFRITWQLLVSENADFTLRSGSQFKWLDDRGATERSETISKGLIDQPSILILLESICTAKCHFLC